MSEHDFARRCRRIGMAWAALLALLLLSLGSAYLPLGRLNVAIGLAIAALKSALVLALFMGLGRSAALARVAAAVAAGTLALLFGLGSVDYATRVTEPAAMQPPQQLRPLRQGGSGR
ncbi:cytochrome C oxidase subunit IV family protein [Azohydromonas lata]|uniref:Caa(3)-type oxidase subunit IV n=1 Tax=Azohydromonas lata TaxID=45677 RepID=A0ABU5IE14_9BURK|nr:cytochrome C oxidase subunit IV family protein [Azohydromonas lata]MDZ5457354.1 Caa(3)-type oxidase subunit IV [Azohydromonas lata]